MPIPYKRAKAILEMLGVNGPSAWASEEAKYPAVTRVLFLKAVWCNVIDDDPSWMDEWVSGHPIPAAIQRMLAKGIDPDDLTDVVRDMQIDVLFNLLVSLDDSQSGIEDLQKRIPENVEWCLAEWDGEKGRLKRPIQDLHGDFYDFDPTGRRGEPRKRTKRTKSRKR